MGRGWGGGGGSGGFGTAVLSGRSLLGCGRGGPPRGDLPGGPPLPPRGQREPRAGPRVASRGYCRHLPPFRMPPCVTAVLKLSRRWSDGTSRSAERSGASLRDVTLCQEQLQMGTAYDIQAYRLLAPGESQYDEDEAT